MSVCVCERERERQRERSFRIHTYLVTYLSSHRIVFSPLIYIYNIRVVAKDRRVLLYQGVFLIHRKSQISSHVISSHLV